MTSRLKAHANCDKCGLHEACKTPWMAGSGATDPTILIVGEAPGREEDALGEPFVGKSGELLRGVIEALEMEDKCRLTNIVRCRPEDNKFPKWAIDYCKHYTEEEIEETDPDLVILLGNSPLRGILGESGITRWHGSVVEKDGRKYVPLFHPAYVLRNQGAMDEWLAGFATAIESLDEDIAQERHDQCEYPKTLQELRQMRDYLNQHEWIAYDLETSSLDAFQPESLIAAVSFATADRAFAFPLESPFETLSDAEYFARCDIIEDILVKHDRRLIGHNIKFDLLWTRQILDIHVRAGGDTMLLSHLIDTRRGIHGLKHLAGVYLDMYGYDNALEIYKKEHPEANPNRGGSYAMIPPDVLLPYAALDSLLTMRLWNLLKEKVTPKQFKFYLEVIVGASNALAEMEFNGNKIDKYIAQRYATIYDVVQEEKYNKLLNDPDVRKAVEILQKEADHKLSEQIIPEEDWEEFGEERDLLADVEITETRVKYKPRSKRCRSRRKRNRQRNVIEFNPNSVIHLRTLYYDVKGMPVVEQTDSGFPTTSSRVLKSLADEYPVVNHVRYYKLLGKMLSTYLMPAALGEWESGDGRVRSTYNQHGTRTGRLSSSDPNLQNIPTPEKEPGTLLETLPIKNIFTHTFEGGCLLQVDYSGMELRVFASLARCEPMLEIHRSGKDFHTMVSTMISGIPYDEITKPVRYRYKWTNWTLLYGGDEWTLHNLYGIPIDEAKETIKEYYSRFPEVPEFMQESIEFAETFGYIESPFGRREMLNHINDRDDYGRRAKDRRSAINMPVQSAASDTLLCAIIIIDREMKRRNMKSMLVNTVHDSIVFDTHPEEIDEIAEMCVDIMENIAEYAKTELPGANFQWLRCPLSADVDVGENYGTYISYEKWVKNGRVFP